jgi:uncharacterized protein involved in exopolysaccharide biosynthesis
MSAASTPARLVAARADTEVAGVWAGREDTTLDYVRLLAARWRVLLALFVAGVAAGGLVSRLGRPVYASSVILAVSDPKIGVREGRGATIRDFATLLENHATAADTIRRFKLDAPPYELGPEQFLLRVVRTEPIAQTSLLRLTVRMPDPRLAADIASDMATRARDLTQRLTLDETTQARGALATHLADTRQRLDAAQAEVTRVKTEGQYDLLKRDVEILLGQRKDLKELTTKIAGERAWVTRAEAELARRGRIDVLTRSIEGDDVLREAARASGAASVLGLATKNEFVNSSYDDLDSRVSRSRADLSGFEQQRDQLTRVSGLGQPSLQRLSELYALETRVSRLEVELELARRVYLDTAMAYEQIQTQVTSRSPTLQIVDPAFVPDRPEPRRTVRNAGIGGLALLMLGILTVLSSRVLAIQPRH